MTSNIIPSDKRQETRMQNPGKNNLFVGSRDGGPMEQSRTKSASIKHNNPEYFKRQADKKHGDNWWESETPKEKAARENQQKERMRKPGQYEETPDEKRRREGRESVASLYKKDAPPSGGGKSSPEDKRVLEASRKRHEEQQRMKSGNQLTGFHGRGSQRNSK